MNLQLQKDNSFNRSFERENGYNFCFLGPNKLMHDFSLNRGNSINRNGSLNLGFNPYKREGKQPINLFVELADEGNNDKNDDFLNLNILQKNGSSVRPMLFRDKSFNSCYSLNVNTGNEFIHNPTPIKPKMEERQPKLELKQEESKEVSPLECEATNDKTKQVALPLAAELNNTDSGDLWVKTQTRVFDQNGYNWNQEVEGLLDETEEELQPSPVEKPKKQRSSKPATPANVNIRRHRKKSKKQLEVLESHFDLDVEWSLELVEKLASELCLEKDQVYKWNWDKRKRLRKKAEREGRALPMKNKQKNKRQKIN